MDQDEAMFGSEVKPKKKISFTKWFAFGLGGLIGISHIGMIGSLSNRQSKLPSINLPVGPYTSYEAEVGHNGYKISYKANDPKVMRVERDSNTKGGFLGLANNKVKVVEQYTMDGAVHNKSNTVQKERQTENQKLASKQSEEQNKQEDSWVPALVLVLLLALLIFPLLVGLLLVG